VTTTESVPLREVKAVALSHVVDHPSLYTAGSSGQAASLSISWGLGSRLELEPAQCGDPTCEAHHGFSGITSKEDIQLQASAEAIGEGAIEDLLAFARALSAATARVA
jgi:hypothetical protein